MAHGGVCTASPHSASFIARLLHNELMQLRPAEQPHLSALDELHSGFRAELVIPLHVAWTALKL